MIFVALGTLEHPFNRLLDAIEREIANGVITEPVIVQAGKTIYKSNSMKIIDLLSMNEFENNVKNANLIICHAGYGTLSIALEAEKKVIAAARQAKYGEHVNDHQTYMLDEYERKGYIMALNDFDKLCELLLKMKKFVPVPYKKNNILLQNIISDFIDHGY
jgi:UDP-N-acetylglucosamine transferase subunit ALG13